MGIVRVIKVKRFCGRNAWKTVISYKMWKALCDYYPQSGKYNLFANKTSTMWNVCQQNFHNVECVIRKPSQYGKYANKTSTMLKLC